MSARRGALARLRLRFFLLSSGWPLSGSVILIGSNLHRGLWQSCRIRHWVQSMLRLRFSSTVRK